MKSLKDFELNRRAFITRIMPTCAVTCLGLGNSYPLFTQSADNSGAQQEKHKFDTEYPRKLTYNQVFEMEYRNFIDLIQFLSQEKGKDDTVKFLKKYSSERSARFAKMSAERSGKNDFEALKKILDPDSGRFQSTLIFEATESTDKVYQLKVKECIWASPFLKAKAGDLGFAAICYGDYAWATAFNPKIEMVREQTLMQGHDICDHRYLWKS